MKIPATKRLGSIAVLSALPILAHATQAYRAWTVSEMQSSAASPPATATLIYIAQRNGSVDVPWSNNSTSCSTEWAYFDASKNPHFAAMAIAAETTDKVLRVYVDDTLPKIGGICQVAFLSLMPD